MTRAEFERNLAAKVGEGENVAVTQTRVRIPRVLLFRLTLTPPLAAAEAEAWGPKRAAEVVTQGSRAAGAVA